MLAILEATGALLTPSRRDILTTREKAKLQTEVREMRENARSPGNKHPDRFDIKADAGGITDIEFAQYLVLRHASDKPKPRAGPITFFQTGIAGAERHWRILGRGEWR